MRESDIILIAYFSHAAPSHTATQPYTWSQARALCSVPLHARSATLQATWSTATPARANGPRHDRRAGWTQETRLGNCPPNASLEPVLPFSQSVLVSSDVYAQGKQFKVTSLVASIVCCMQWHQGDKVKKGNNFLATLLVVFTWVTKGIIFVTSLIVSPVKEKTPFLFQLINKEKNILNIPTG